MLSEMGMSSRLLQMQLVTEFVRIKNAATANGKTKGMHLGAAANTSEPRVSESTRLAFECCMCLEPMTQPVTLMCGHSACKQHLEQWFYVEKKDTCPQCKAKVPAYAMRDMHVNIVLNDLIAKAYPGHGSPPAATPLTYISPSAPPAIDDVQKPNAPQWSGAKTPSAPSLESDPTLPSKMVTNSRETYKSLFPSDTKGQILGNNDDAKSKARSNDKKKEHFQPLETTSAMHTTPASTAPYAAMPEGYHNSARDKPYRPGANAQALLRLHNRAADASSNDTPATLEESSRSGALYLGCVLCVPLGFSLAIVFGPYMYVQARGVANSSYLVTFYAHSLKVQVLSLGDWVDVTALNYDTCVSQSAALGSQYWAYGIMQTCMTCQAYAGKAFILAGLCAIGYFLIMISCAILYYGSQKPGSLSAQIRYFYCGDRVGNNLNQYMRPLAILFPTVVLLFMMVSTDYTSNGQCGMGFIKSILVPASGTPPPTFMGLYILTPSVPAGSSLDDVLAENNLTASVVSNAAGALGIFGFFIFFYVLAYAQKWCSNKNTQ